MSLFGDGKREARLAMLVLLVLVILQHAPGLFFGQHRHVDASLQVSEGAVNQELLQPAMAQAMAAVEAGSLPTWNPSSRFGEPFSVTGAPVWYPPFWLLGVSGLPIALELLLCLHAFIACCTMFRFLRSLTISRYVAFLGGGSYGLGWFYVASLGRLPEAAAAAWLPLVLELTWRTLRSRERKRSAPWLGFVLALSFATGGTSTAILATVMAAAVLLSGLRLVDRESRASGLREIGLAAGIAVLCSAPLWLEAIQMGSYVRTGVDVESRRLQFEGLAGLFAPGGFQHLDGSGPMRLELINPGADALELALYPGAMMLFAALLGLFRPKRTLRGLFWVLTGAVGVVLTLDGPLGGWLIDPLPVHLSSPGSGLLLMHVAAIVLGCTALDNFFDAPAARRFSVPLTSLLAGGVAAGLLVTAWLLPGALLSPVLSTLERHAWGGAGDDAFTHVALQLLPFGITAVLIAAVFPFWHRLGVLRFKWIIGTVAMAELVAIGLVFVPRDAAPASALDADRLVASIPESSGRAFSAGHGELPAGSLLAARGVRTVNTNAPAILDRSARLLEAVDPALVRSGRRPTVGRLAVGAQFDDPLLALGAVDIAIAKHPVVAHDFAPISAAPGPAGAGAFDDGIHVAYRRELATGNRARIYFDAIPVDGVESAVASLRAATDDMPLVVEHAPPNFRPRPGIELPKVEFVVDRPDLIELDVDLDDGRGYLVLADAWAPGWQAWVDGEWTPIVHAQVAFRAVPLREGAHRVVMRYEPWSKRFGLPIAAFGTMLVLLLQLGRMLGYRRGP